jgi:glyoxylase-like metal-dependent hydrolase (beta-lactamase superfamily II)
VNEFLLPSDLGEGIWRIPVPVMGIPIAYTLVYVVDSSAGPVLIDAGWDDDVAWSSLEAGLAHFGISPSDIYGVVATHHHPDHAGLAWRVREASGGWFAMHRRDAELLEEVRGVGGAKEQLAYELGNFLRAGASDSDLAEFEASGSFAAETLPMPPDRRLDDGDLADVPGRRVRVVWTPGHTPGHMCLYLEDTRTLFSGDHILSDTTPHIGAYDYPLGHENPLGDYLQSLKRVLRLEPDHVLPAHEKSFDLAARVSYITRHHEERLTELLAIVGTGTQTLWSAAASLAWAEPWAKMDPVNHQLALAELAAHMRLLVERGLVEVVQGADPLRYERTSGSAVA